MSLPVLHNLDILPKIMKTFINRTVLMSGAGYFTNDAAINPYMHNTGSVDMAVAAREHARIKQALEQAGVTVVQVPPPARCQDGIYTANWALCRGGRAVAARLPNARKAEETYARQVLEQLGKEVISLPDSLRFSGQGDALPCGDYLFAGSTYRTDPEVHSLLGELLGYQVISLQTVPQLDARNRPVINQSSGWPDSYFYDIDLALAILKPSADEQPGLIAWCPDAFTPESQATLRAFSKVEKIEVSLQEAKDAFACNLISTGETVVMGAYAPKLKQAIKQHGLRVITPEIHELTKGGGYIRCTTLTLDNN
jgi:N-dimethylarginine dimethylaminohydrolase